MHASILFVEDEEALQMTVGDRLRNEGYRVEYASNGDEAYEKAILLGFDVLLLDISMPEAAGIELLDQLTALGRFPPSVVFVTACQQHALGAFHKHAVECVRDRDQVDRYACVHQGEK